MALYFLDSSAIVKRYHKDEVGSAWLTELILSIAPTILRNSLHIALVSGVEVVAALTRRQRMGNSSAEETAQAIARFQREWRDMYETVRLDHDVIQHAMLLAQRYGLRGYDAVQLASAMEVGSLARQLELSFVFISADDRLNAAAVEEGLQTDNPNFHL